MRAIEFEILLSLADGDRHGYAIIQDIEARGAEAARIETGTLYRALQRLVEEGLVRPVDGPNEPGQGPRRRYYQLTQTGRAQASAEARRLAGLVEAARAARLLTRGT
ncbi:MAG: helix-turn-helix transcriptional regulator [Gemmatimonadales bacterium]|nr:helix-turn-helix transcriptional regulator [Gemmatimonadales bacterium]